MSDAAAWSLVSPQAGSLIGGVAPFVALLGGVFLALGLAAFLFRWFRGRAASVAGSRGAAVSGGGFQSGSGLPVGALRLPNGQAGDSLRRAVGGTVAAATAARARSESKTADSEADSA